MNPTQEYRRTLIFVRYVLPGALTLAGIIVICAQPHGAALHGGMGIVGAGLAAFLFAFLAKVSMTGDTSQQKDAEAARFFDEHGYWPDEDPSKARR